jgi:hypothetical protein
MQFRLHPHPDFPPSAVSEVLVEVGRWPDGSLQLDYSLYGKVGRLALPAVAPPERQDELWRTTCFEAFLRPPSGYWEFNFSPSESWAAYEFTGYRAGMRMLELPVAPDLSLNDTGRWLGLDVNLHLPEEIDNAPLGLSAVIEEKSGAKSYWALAHPEGPPDFHHEACFAATLPSIGG